MGAPVPWMAFAILCGCRPTFNWYAIFGGVEFPYHLE